MKYHKNKKQKEYYNLNEVSKILGKDRDYLWNYIQESKLKLSKHTKVHKDDLAAFTNYLNAKVETKVGVSSRLAFALLWGAAFCSFVFTIDTSGENIGKILPASLAYLFLGNIVIGVIAFLGIFVKPIKGFKENRLSTYIPLLAFFYFLFYSATMSFNGIGLIAGLTRQNDVNYSALLPTVSTPTPTIPSPTPLEQKTYEQIPTQDPDPIVSCTSSAPNCNGSSIRLHQSQCSQITCCQIGSSWSVYSSTDKCIEAQNAIAQPPQQNKQQSPGNNFYCWNNAYGYAYYTSSGDQCNADNAKSTAYKTCMDTQKMKADTCNLGCKTELDKENNICAWAYTGSTASIANDPTKYGDCLNGPDGSGAHYSTCLSSCSDQYAQDIKQCSNL